MANRTRSTCRGPFILFWCSTKEYKNPFLRWVGLPGVSLSWEVKLVLFNTHYKLFPPVSERTDEREDKWPGPHNLILWWWLWTLRQRTGLGEGDMVVTIEFMDSVGQLYSGSWDYVLSPSSPLLPWPLPVFQSQFPEISSFACLAVMPQSQEIWN